MSTWHHKYSAMKECLPFFDFLGLFLQIYQTYKFHITKQILVFNFNIK